MANSTEPLLSRFPELAALEHDPAIAAALHGTDAGQLYKALRRWLSRHGAASDAMTVRQVLQNRRRFLVPVKSAPKLATLNGVGARIYGASERNPQDGTYITTLYFTVLYIPIFPLGQYLVRKADRKRFAFFGKVPLSESLRWWRKLWGVGLAVAAVAIAIAVGSASKHSTVHLINGFDVPVEVSAAGRRVLVPPSSQVAVEWPSGPVAVTATTEKGEVIDHATCDIASLTSALQAYDIAGVQPLYREDIYYATSSATPPKPPEPTILAGQRCLSIANVDYAFTEPPKSIEMDSDQETRVHVDLTPGGWRLGVLKLLFSDSAADQKTAKTVVANVLAARPQDQDLVTAATGMLGIRSSPSELASLLGPIATAHPNAIPIQRAYEDALRDAGKEAEALQRYKTAFEKQPGSPTAAYLYARILPFDEAAPIYIMALAKSPKDVWLRFAYATVLTHARRFADALPLFESLWKDAPEKRGPMFADYAAALAAQHRTSDALALAKALKRSDEMPWQNAVAYACLVRLSGDGAAVSTLDIAKQVLDPHQVTPGTAEELQWLSGQPAEVKPEGAAADDLKALQLLSALANDPSAALSLHDLPKQVRLLGPGAVLLAGEAWRTGDHKNASAMLASVMPSEYAQAVGSYWQDGKPPASLDDMPLDAQAAAEFARSRMVTGAERQKLVAQAKADDVLHGLVSTAIARWPAP